jgi:hypothetical protein
MTRRIFTRNPKNEEIDATQQPLPSVLTSREAAAIDTSPDRAMVPRIPVVAPQDRRPAGWYPEETDSGLMRYWDGFHFTGQAKRAHSASTGESQARVHAAAPLTSDQPLIDWTHPDADDLDVAVGPRLAPLFADLPVILGLDQKEPATVSLSAGPNASPNSPQVQDPPHVSADSPVLSEPRETGEDETVNTHAIAQVKKIVIGQGGHRSDEDLSVSSDDQGAADGAENWAKDTERAVIRAMTVDTPEAWEEAAKVAVVVSEVAQTMQAAADAKQTARQTANAAEEAAEIARMSSKAAADAGETAERMAKSAQDAAESARLAAQKAVESKEDAERKAQAAPMVAEKAEVAARASADAKQKAQDLEQLVAKARSANTASAWSEALKLAALAVDTRDSLGESVTEPAAENTPQQPLLWRRSTPVVESGVESLDQTVGVPERSVGLWQGQP